MNTYPSDMIYRSRLARHQDLMAEAAVERQLRAVRNRSKVRDGATRLLKFALRRRPATSATSTGRVVVAE